MQKREK